MMARLATSRPLLCRHCFSARVDEVATRADMDRYGPFAHDVKTVDQEDNFNP